MRQGPFVEPLCRHWAMVALGAVEYSGHVWGHVEWWWFSNAICPPPSPTSCNNLLVGFLPPICLPQLPSITTTNLHRLYVTFTKFYEGLPTDRARPRQHMENTGKGHQSEF